MAKAAAIFGVHLRDDALGAVRADMSRLKTPGLVQELL